MIDNESIIVAIVEKSSDLELVEKLINYGVNFLFIADNNILQLVREAFYLAYKGKAPYPDDFNS